MPTLIEDTSAGTQLAQVVRALEDEFGESETERLERIAARAYRRISRGVRVRSFLPILAERAAREQLRESHENAR